MTIRRVLLAATGLSALAGTGSAAGQSVGSEVTDVVIVEAAPLRHAVTETALSVATLAGDDLVHRRQATLGETLQGIPGVHADTFGAGASRPVIRGQASPRVKSLSDGSELMDASAVSPDHAITTEPLLLRKIEVLRGPAALLYGGGAIGGAVNLIDDRIPTEMPAGGVAGVAELRGGTNAKERAGVVGLTAGVGSLALHAEGVSRDSDAYRAPGRGRIAGTDLENRTWSAGASWIGDAGFLGAAFTRQRSDYGLPGHSHDYESCHPHGVTLHCGGHGEEEDHDHDHGEGEAEDIPVVRLRSERVDVRGEVRTPMAGIDRIRLRAGVTDYRHDELDEGVPATTFRNDGYDVRLEVEHAPVGPVRGVVGLQRAESDFSARGAEAFLPGTETRSTGLFILEEMNWRDWHVELAARKDWQDIEGDGSVTRVRPTGHAPLSVSAAARWDMAAGYSVALALSRSQRAPSAQELFARGIHLATNTYEIGNAALNMETARTVDLTFRKTAGDTTLTLGVFHHRIDGYVFAETLDRFEDFRLIRYAQQDARFTGIDGEVRQQIGPDTALTLFGDYVRAKLADGTGNLPRIPAGRLGLRAERGWEVGGGRLGGEVEYAHVFTQGKVAAFEERTGGYDMVNATLSYRLPADSGGHEIYVRATNLLDELALNHASFVSRAAPLPGRTVVVGLRTAF